ncbi:amidohydrolase family-domain-containing protein [Thelonectria olida]|uniref:Amidohydrolase family-domain-containing protein n=1 Tax=Thelonectria olida TaxID=1576542 RepID=A0A9P8VU50_9HYPO|nr:amidohydrolase family-domain-containing protein [Thelonectria olida]
MPGCLEGHHAAATQILNGINHEALLAEFGKQANRISNASPESRIYYSSTNPAPIITMKNGQFSAVAAMAIGDGKVLKTGTLDEVKAAAPSVPPTDLKSNCIVPGFVEPHVHIITSAMLEKFLLNCDPLNEATGGTFDGTIAYIEQAAGELEPGAWLLGYGYDPSRLEPQNGSFPDLTTDVFETHNLNKRNPILIVNASGHIAYANNPAVALAGVKNPNNGVFAEAAAYMPIVLKAMPPDAVTQPKVVEGFHELLRGWSSKGFTTVFDAGVGLNDPAKDASTLTGLTSFAPLRIAGAAADLKLDQAACIVGPGQMPTDGATDLKIKTVKLWFDGSTQGFTGALEEPYYEMLPSYFRHSPCGWADWKVHDTCKIEPATHNDIRTEMRKWASRGYQLMVHVNGDCASEVVLDAFENLDSPFPNIRHRIDHFTVTHLEQVQRAARLNLCVSHTIGHVKYWGHTFSKYILGTDRAARIDPVRDDVDNGLVYSLHSDSPVSQADGLSYVRTAVTRLMYEKCSEKPEVVLGPSQKVTVEQALAGITINPARQILLDKEIGTLEERKNADFVVLSQDIASPSIDARDISSDWVLETWFQGCKRYPVLFS